MTPLPLAHDIIPRGVGLAVGASALTLALGYPLPGLLRHLGVGKAISPYQPAGHQVKSGTPSMAGLLFNGVALVLGAVAVAPFYPDVWLLLALLLACTALGLIDDLSSSLRYRRRGIRARVKLGWLLVVAGIIVALAQLTLHLHVMRVPFAGRLDLGLLYWPVAVLVVVATSNAVNLTDGLDGLAGGTVAIAIFAYAALALVRGESGVALFLLALAGALLGFVWHNVHPARFFMGDTGALALGAVLAGAALLTGDVVVLLVIGAVFVAVTLSVIVQLAYYRRTGGRRLLRASPLHHHFELCGWSETRIVRTFWLAGAASAVVGVGLALTS